ncbi:MAG: hypothetical protein AAB389_05160 [Patescibacteria group bacterium]
MAIRTGFIGNPTKHYVSRFFKEKNMHRNDGNDEIGALPLGMTVITREEMIEGIIGETVSEVLMSSDELIKEELDVFYAEHPKALVEHIRKNS